MRIALTTALLATATSLAPAQATNEEIYLVSLSRVSKAAPAKGKPQAR